MKLIIGAILIISGVFLFYCEYNKTKEDLEKEKREKQLTEKQMKWGRQNILSGSVLLIFIGVLIVLM